MSMPMMMAMPGIGSDVPTAAPKGLDILFQQMLDSYAVYLGKDDALYGNRLADDTEAARLALESEMGQLSAELGEDFIRGVRPAFKQEAVRHYDSWWNWVLQDLVEFFTQIATTTSVDPEELQEWVLNDVENKFKLLQGKNRASDRVVAMLTHITNMCSHMGWERLTAGVDMFNSQIKMCLSIKPHFIPVWTPTAPKVSICKSTQELKYREAPRPGVTTVPEYVKEMRGLGTKTTTPASRAPVDRKRKGFRARRRGSATGAPSAPNLFADEPLLTLSSPAPGHKTPSELTNKMLDVMADMAEKGVSFAGKVALVSGCGRGSIAFHIVESLLMGGAHVVATTSSFSLRTTKLFRGLYEKYGSRGSKLTLLPFNQGSSQDVTALVQYLMGSASGELGLHLDYVVPFAALSEAGKDISSIDSKSELSHRVMLTNLLRLLGEIKTHKERASVVTRPTQVILPLSPNHGVFGGDGLYAESKLGLEALLNKYSSEGWHDYLSICGAIIGWTRGTGLMSGNNIVAPAMELRGLRTFSTLEMAFNLVAMLHPSMTRECSRGPLLADFGGGFARVQNLKEATASERAAIMNRASISKQLAKERKMEAALSGDQDEKAAKAAEQPQSKVRPGVRPGAFVEWPTLPSESTLASMPNLSGMVDLQRVVVIAGYGEVGPWGSSRTRWQMEAEGTLSMEGTLELAWITGRVKASRTKEGTVQWLDSSSGEVIDESQVKKLYEQKIIQASGVRLVVDSDALATEGYDPKNKQFMQQVAIDKHMPPIEVSSLEEALEYRAELGENLVDIWQNQDGQYMMRIKKGAVLWLPKALQFNRLVAGQVPTGWDASKFGISKDIAEQVDPLTLYALVSTAEALVCAGINDAYEMYQYVHVSEVGNSLGSGMGGMRSLRRIFRERMQGGKDDVQADVLQESFINTIPACKLLMAESTLAVHLFNRCGHSLLLCANRDQHAFAQRLWTCEDSSGCVCHCSHLS